MGGMELTVLGSGTIVPSLTRWSPGYVLRAGPTTILIDLGPGTLRRMVEAGAGLVDIDAVCLSHFHPDHIADFVPLVFASKYAMGSQRQRDLTVVAPAGFGELYAGLIEVFGNWIVPEAYRIDLRESDGSPIDVGSCRVTTAPVNHNPESIAYRFEGDGVSLVYSGDTDWSEELIILARGADLLLLECSFPDNMKIPGHLTPSEAGRLARDAGVSHLVLTHLYPPVEDVDIVSLAGASFPGRVTVAEDLMVIRVGRSGISDIRS
jgi:ribonuclease BN (tRNA processing enzyme)